MFLSIVLYEYILSNIVNKLLKTDHIRLELIYQFCYLQLINVINLIKIQTFELCMELFSI